jgi:hypothetical protein
MCLYAACKKATAVLRCSGAVAAAMRPRLLSVLAASSAPMSAFDLQIATPMRGRLARVRPVQLRVCCKLLHVLQPCCCSCLDTACVIAVCLILGHRKPLNCACTAVKYVHWVAVPAAGDKCNSRARDVAAVLSNIAYSALADCFAHTCNNKSTAVFECAAALLAT